MKKGEEGLKQGHRLEKNCVFGGNKRTKGRGGRGCVREERSSAAPDILYVFHNTKIPLRFTKRMPGKGQCTNGGFSGTKRWLQPMGR